MSNKQLKLLAFAVCLISLIGIISAVEGGSQNVRVNVLPEFLIVNSPINGMSYSNPLVDINVTLDVFGSKVDYIKWSFDKHTWKTLCTNCHDYGLLNKKTRGFSEGEQEIEFRLMTGNKILQEKTVKFFIDSENPVILKMYPSSGTAVNGDEFYIKYSEDNLKEITLYYGTDKITKTNQECIPGKKKECVFNVDLSKYNKKWIEYQFKVSDFASSVVSDKRRIFVDLDAPKLIINSPKDGNTYDSRFIPFKLNTSEYSEIEYIDLAQKNPSWKKICENCNSFGIDKEEKIYFLNGAHKLSIRTTDSAGNYEIKTINFNVKSKNFFS
jgi:hypothetical protein